MSTRYFRALFLSASILMSAAACGSGGGTTTYVGGGPAGSGDCHERLAADSNAVASGITIKEHRIVATVSVWCTGSVSPATYKVTLIIVKDGVHGAGISSAAIPTAQPADVKVSTGCSAGVYSAWYVVAGTWPGGLPIQGASGTPVARKVSANEC